MVSGPDRGTETLVAAWASWPDAVSARPGGGSVPPSRADEPGSSLTRKPDRGTCSRARRPLRAGRFPPGGRADGAAPRIASVRLRVHPRPFSVSLPRPRNGPARSMISCLLGDFSRWRSTQRCGSQTSR